MSFGAAEPVLPPVVSRKFGAIRMAVLREGDWQAFVHYGQTIANHAQEEALTYELHHGRDRVTTDSATVLYSSPYHQQYFRSAAAHNVPLVDGLGQQRWNQGEVAGWDAAQGSLDVSHPNYRADVAVSRHYRITSSGFEETSRIALTGTATAAKRLGGAFHTDCTVQPGSGLVAAPTAPAVPATDATAYWRIDSQFQAGATWSVRLACGARAYEMRVANAAGSPQQVYIGQAPTRPLPNLRGVVYFETVDTAATFTTTISALD